MRQWKLFTPGKANGNMFDPNHRSQHQGRDRMKTILVVDQTSSTLLMLKGEFAGLGYEVLTTDSGEEALKILHDPAKPVDLVITNLRHAGPHGLDFIWLIKKTWPQLPIICHTALYEYIGLGSHDRPFDVFVEKSSNLTNLKQNVGKLMGNAK
jgi:DNA-binding NtrC family response regulator